MSSYDAFWLDKTDENRRVSQIMRSMCGQPVMTPQSLEIYAQLDNTDDSPNDIKFLQP